MFEGERLADVVTEMNRYSIEKLEISDPALGSRKVSGVFEPTEAHAFAKALQAYGIARTTEQGSTSIVTRCSLTEIISENISNLCQSAKP